MGHHHTPWRDELVALVASASLPVVLPKGRWQSWANTPSPGFPELPTSAAIQGAKVERGREVMGTKLPQQGKMHQLQRRHVLPTQVRGDGRWEWDVGERNGGHPVTCGLKGFLPGPCPWGAYHINAPQEILINENVSHQRRPSAHRPAPARTKLTPADSRRSSVSLTQLLWAPENKTLYCVCLTFLFLQVEQLLAPL